MFVLIQALSEWVGSRRIPPLILDPLICAVYMPHNVLTGHLIRYRVMRLINIGFHSWELEQNIITG